MANKKDPKKTEEKKIEVVEKKAEVTVLPVAPAVALPKAFYIEKEKGNWKLVICDVDGDKLINKKVKDSDNKALALEYFKIQFARHYYFGK